MTSRHSYLTSALPLRSKTEAQTNHGPGTVFPGERGTTMRNWSLWFKAAGIRALRTFAQTAVALLPAAATIESVDWRVVASTAALAAVASLLTSLAGIPEEEMEQ